LQLLDQFAPHPDYCRYLAYILCRGTGEEADVRAMAGLVLKNRVRGSYVTLTPATAAYVRAHLLTALADPLPLVRATAGTVVAAMALKTGFRGWDALLPALVQGLGDANPVVAEVSRTHARPLAFFFWGGGG
jgi:hypothetical protein